MLPSVLNPPGLGYTDSRRTGTLLSWGAIPDVVAAGESAWMRFIDRTSPVDREVLRPTWLTRELIATPEARAKVTAFTSRTPAPWSLPTPADVLARLTFVGDIPMAHCTARLLADRLPAAVTDYVINRVTFIGAGVQTLGFCGAPMSFGDRPWLIVLTGSVSYRDAVQDLEALIAHEVAHAWTLAEPSPDTRAAGAFWMQTMQATPFAEIPEDVRQAIEAARAGAVQAERLANELTRSWGFPDAGATVRRPRRSQVRR